MKMLDRLELNEIIGRYSLELNTVVRNILWMQCVFKSESIHLS